jgi:hypothetical protein
MDRLVDYADYTWDAIRTGTGFVNVSNNFGPMSLWRAATIVAQSQSGYIRETPTSRQLELKRGSTDSGIKLINAEEIFRNLPDNIGLVNGLPEVAFDGSNIFNRIIPIGESEDGLEFTLQESTRTTPYTVQSVLAPTPSIVDTTFEFGSTTNGEGGTIEAKNGNTNFEMGSVHVAGHNTVVLAYIRIGMFDVSGTYEDPVISKVTIGGRPADLIGRAGVPAGAHHDNFYAFYAVNVPPGEVSVRGVKSFNGGLDIALISIQDVNLLDPLFDAAVTNGTGGTASDSLSSITTDMLLLAGLAVYNTSGSNPSVSSSDTLIYNQAGAASVEQYAGAYRVNDSGTVSMSFSITPSTGSAWAIIVAAFNRGKIYYLEDAASVAAYGRRTKFMTMKSARQVPGTSLVNNANTLHDRASNELTQGKDGVTSYKLSITSLPGTGWLPGDSMQLIYKGRSRGTSKYLDINQSLIVMERRRSWQTQVPMRWDLTLSNVYKFPWDISEALYTNDERLSDLER